MAKSKCRLPDPFDGLSSCTRFFKRYELCCDLNKWETDGDKVGQLFPLLADKVFDFASDLPDTDKTVYKNLKKRILAEFEDVELEEMYAERFTALKLGKDEDLGSFMATLKRLVVKAYPSFNEADRAKLVMNQFMKSLSGGTRSHIMLQPKEEVLTMASCDEMLSKARKMHQIERTPSSQEGQRVAAVEVEKENTQLDKILVALEDLTKVVGATAAAPSVARVQGSSQAQGNRSTRNRSSQFKGNCFKCGEPGHMARSCGKVMGLQYTAICKLCGNRGHEEPDCMLRRRQKSCKLCGNVGHEADDCAMRGKKWLNY